MLMYSYYFYNVIQGEGFEPLIHPNVVVALFDQVKVSSAPISKSAVVCIERIINATTIGWPYIIKCSVRVGLESKNPLVQMSCAQFVLMVLQSWSQATIHRCLDDVAHFVKASLNSKDGTARKIARKSYWVFEKHFPDKSEEILDALDANTQRHLLENKVEGDIHAKHTLAYCITPIYTNLHPY